MDNAKNQLVFGILAHVDAGKTTLSEAMLYLCGNIRRLGRVDNRDAFLDTHELERDRGITIFSKQARFSLGDMDAVLMDTPGHVDFSAEMERALQVLDYAVLVINGADGVQGHTRTLWKLLSAYRLPVFLFVNKMDQEGTDRSALMRELKSQLDENCVDFSGEEDTLEELAMCDSVLLEEYLESGKLEQDSVAAAVAGRKVFPCCFGSALRLTGVREFLDILKNNVRLKTYPEQFGARVYKIGRDGQGNRLTYMKITGGSLRVKDPVISAGKDGPEEKADQIRIYSGEKYETAREVRAGTICAVTGLHSARPGEGLGWEQDVNTPVLTPVLNYRIELPEGCDAAEALQKLRQVEEEEPLLHIVWMESLGELHAQVMGEVQIEILERLIRERFGMEVTFGSGRIVYQETIAGAVKGAGHFEPLRHYAEVHLLLEPGERGGGLQFETVCSEDVLDRNWQRLILSSLKSQEHPGVLTGSPITDMKITLLAGKSHLKHTEGGDFRQAAFRALRQGLMKAECILLEPYYDFRLELPRELVGRAMTDLQRMGGSFDAPGQEGENAVLKGKAPAALLQNYQQEVTSYSKGTGRLSCALRGYEPCHNTGEVVEQIGYDPAGDAAHPADSIFCAHGAGYAVPWNQADRLMHIQDIYGIGDTEAEVSGAAEAMPVSRGGYHRKQDAFQEDAELERIFEQTYGKIKRKSVYGSVKSATSGVSAASGVYHGRDKRPREEYLLVDGYNIIFAWEELRELAGISLDGARSRLMDILCNYQGFVKCTLILVFDAYKVKGGHGEVSRYHGIHVVYTKEAETADQYIEKTVHEIGRKYRVTVATSDAVEQVIILGQGAVRMSAMGLKEEVERAGRLIREEHLEKQEQSRNYLEEAMPDEMKNR